MQRGPGLHSITLGGIDEETYERLTEVARLKGKFNKSGKPNVTMLARDELLDTLDEVKINSVRTAEVVREDRSKVMSQLGPRLSIFKNFAWWLYKDSKVEGLDNITQIFEPTERGQVQGIITRMREFLEPKDFQLTLSWPDPRHKGHYKHKEYQLTEKQLSAYQRYLELGFELKELATRTILATN